MRPARPAGLYFTPNLLQLKPLPQPRDFVLIPGSRDRPRRDLLTPTTAGAFAARRSWSTRYEAADGSVAPSGIGTVDPNRESPGEDRGRLELYLWGRDRHAGGDPLHHASSRAWRPH